jgi:hypothetical protein
MGIIYSQIQLYCNQDLSWKEKRARPLVTLIKPISLLGTFNTVVGVQNVTIQNIGIDANSDKKRR